MKLRRIVFVLAALALLAAASIDGVGLWRAWQHNRAIDTAAIASTAPAPAATLFARAHAAANANRMQDALSQYQAASRDPAHTTAAQFNLGNLHLREALALAARQELQNNPQPVELAKRHFRAALRADPSHWPSKYNLEQALHLAPETPDDSAPAPGHAADQAVTTLRGFTLGLP
jgi:mxaK protein